MSKNVQMKYNFPYIIKCNNLKCYLNISLNIYILNLIINIYIPALFENTNTNSYCNSNSLWDAIKKLVSMLLSKVLKVVIFLNEQDKAT